MSDFKRYLEIALMMSLLNPRVYESHHKSFEVENKGLSEDQKKRIHDEYRRNQHSFNINGEIIVAKSRKDAKKIAERRKKVWN